MAVEAELWVGEDDEGYQEEEENKAGYTAIPVACGWTGAIFEVSGSLAKEPMNAKKVKCDGLAYGRTDAPTKWGVELDAES